MKNRVGFVAVALAVTLTSLVLPCFAFTLGDLRGNAVIGRSLDVAAQVQTGAGEDAAASCIAAEVYHADVRQATPSVSVTPAGTGAAYSALVRVRSAALVDEPVVTLVLRSTCGSTTTRTYVLLADFPPAGLPAVNTSVNPTLASATASADTSTPAGLRATPTVATPTAAAPPRRENTGVLEKKPHPAKASSQGPAAVRAVKPGATERTSADKAARKSAERVPGKAVLKLDPLDILSDRIDSLDSAMLFSPPDDALKQTRQITALQGDIKSLRDLATRNDALLLDLKLKMQQSETQQIPASWFYGLVALLLLCLGALAWLWLRQRRDRPDNETPDIHEKSWQDSVQEASPETVLMPRAAAEAPKAPEVDLDIDLDAITQAESGVVADVAPQDISQPTVSGMGALHSIGVESILDIRQQADFFVSLGQTDRALRILKKQISESSEPNPFIYLDVLTLLHSLGLKADFRDYRTAFNKHFNGVVPDFPAYHFEGKDLLDYPDALVQLVRTWPTASALVFLDASIFRNPKLPSQPSYDLAAFRDLLVLHTLVEEVAADLPWNTPTSPETASIQTRAADIAHPADTRMEFTLVPLPTAAPVVVAKPTEESPSRMLDLDFSTLTAEDIHPDDLAVPEKFWPKVSKP